jgi:hypothetical protein
VVERPSVFVCGHEQVRSPLAGVGPDLLCPSPNPAAPISTLLSRSGSHPTPCAVLYCRRQLSCGQLMVRSFFIFVPVCVCVCVCVCVLL